MTRLSAVALLACSLMAAACGGGDYELPLPGGYFIARVSAGRFVVVAPNRRDIVIPAIEEYQVYGLVVVGRIPKSALASDSYFLLDTAGRQVHTFAGEKEWKERLAQLGLREVELVRPTRWSGWLRS